jgi:hypothetical protein
VSIKTQLIESHTFQMFGKLADVDKFIEEVNVLEPVEGPSIFASLLLNTAEVEDKKKMAEAVIRLSLPERASQLHISKSNSDVSNFPLTNFFLVIEPNPKFL